MLLLVKGKELGINHVQPRRQGGRMLHADSSTAQRHGMVMMKLSRGLRATQKGKDSDICPESCIINSHSVVLSSVRNPTGINRTMHRWLGVPLSLKCFPVCLIYMIAHYHLYKALHSFSAHDKWPSVNETTGHTCYSTVTDDCLMLCFVWKMPLSHFK